jgi:hypothetical protein
MGFKPSSVLLVNDINKNVLINLIRFLKNKVYGKEK